MGPARLSPCALRSPPPLTVYESGAETGHLHDAYACSHPFDCYRVDDAADEDEAVMSQLFGRMHNKQ